MIYAFGEYRLDEERYQLLWRDEALELEPKVFDVLAYLVRHRDRVVPKAELLERLWPDQVVGEWSLTRCVSVARKAVRDSATEQQVIQTLYGRGYRFVAPICSAEDLPSEPPASEPPRTGDLRRPLIGRERQLAELRDGLEAAMAGRGQVFLVTGETGSGKTRLTEALAALSEELGATVRIGRCWETEGAPVYWPWLQILRADTRARGAQALRQLMGSTAPVIAQIVPELREELPDVPKPPPLEPRQARFRLFDAISRLVKRAAQESPLVLMFEDLHCADEPSLRLLEFVARELAAAPLLVVGTYRDDEMLRDSSRSRILADLARACSARYVPLDGLSPDDVGRFVEQVAGESAEEQVIQALHDQTAGNPFFLTQVVPALAEEGLLHSWDPDEPLDLALPRGVRQAILRQLDGLSESARSVLEAASVIGHRFSVGILEQLLDDLGPQRLKQGLAELAERSVVSEDADYPGRYRFSHGLVRDTLYAELPPPTRAQHHLRAGEAFENRPEGGAEAHVAELSFHFSEARSAGGEKKALDYAIAAGRWARERLAYEEACRYYERALDLVELQGVPDESRRCDTLIDLGEAQLRAGDQSASRSTLERAAELARGLHEPERLARAAVAIAQSRSPFARGTVDEDVAALLEAALARLPERDSALRARTLASLALALYWSPEAQNRIARLADEALEMARRVGDPETLLFIMSAVITARWEPDFIEERAQLATEAIRLGQGAGVKEELLDTRVLRLSAWFELGRMDEVDRELAEISRITSELHQTEADEYLPWFQASRAILRGEFARAEELASAFLESVQKRGDETGLVGFSLQFVMLRFTQGRGDELLDVVKHLRERHPAVPTFQAALARVYCELGRVEDARREIERLWPAGRSTGLPKCISWFSSMALLCDTAVMLGDRQRCEAVYRELAPYAHRHICSGAAAYLGSASGYLGMLASELGRYDMAERHFETALQMQAEIGARPATAWTLCEYARMLHRRGSEPERTAELAQQALELARELALPALAERILSLAE